MTHYIVAMVMSPEQQEYFNTLIKNTKFITTKKIKGVCNCSNEVSANIRELRLYEITIREDAEESFELWFSSLIGKIPRFRRIIKWIVKMILNRKGEVSTEFDGMKEFIPFNTRNVLLFKFKNKLDLKNTKTCLKCKRKIPLEWF